MKTYFVNGVEYHSDFDYLTLADILQNARFSPEDSYLISDSGKEYRQPGEKIMLTDGEKFEVKYLRGKATETTIKYEVNGEQQETNQSPLALKTILMNAGRDAGIEPGEVEKFRLENLSTGEKYTDLNELVPISNGDKFAAIYKGATPVA